MRFFHSGRVRCAHHFAAAEKVRTAHPTKLLAEIKPHFIIAPALQQGLAAPEIAVDCLARVNHSKINDIVRVIINAACGMSYTLAH